MIRDTVLFVVGCLILTSLAIFITWDWLESRRIGGLTVSKRALALWKRKQDQPAFWLVSGLIAGFAVGLILGFILGHLFWPQVIEHF